MQDKGGLTGNFDNNDTDVAGSQFHGRLQRPQNKSTVLLEGAVISQMAYYTTPKGSQLSFTTGSLKYSKSIITVKPQSTDHFDEATMTRMRKRRDLIEELLQSEEVYITELKTLLNVTHLPLFSWWQS